MIFRELLDELHISYLTEGHHHCRPGWLQMDCPFCGPGSEKYHLGYNIEHNYAHCWKCGSTSLVSLLTELTGFTAAKCSSLLKDLDRAERIEKIEHRGSLVLPWGIGPLLPAHKAYLRRRGFKVKPLERLWKIKGIGIAAHLQWRIFIPIYYHGKVVSWTTRSISDTGRRYVSAAADQESIPHKTLLYGEDACRQSIIVVEGPTDAWRIGAGAVATCGIGFTAPQLLRMSKYPVRYVCFDSEVKAQKRAQQLCDQLEAFPGTTANITLDAEDAGSARPKEIRQLQKLVMS